MTLQHRLLPSIPQGIDISRLQDNLKLLSDDFIRILKEQFKTNGRYREYRNEANELTALPYAVYLFNGNIFAEYPGKKLTINATDTGKIKLVQDLDSGQWGMDKIISLVESPDLTQLRAEDVENEQKMLVKMDLALLAKKQPIHFTRPLHSKSIVEPELHMPEITTLRRRSGMFRHRARDWDLEPPVSTAGKHHLFMRYVPGMNLSQWIYRKPDLPLIIKFEMASEIVAAVMDIHQKNILHRDLKLKNVIADVFRKFRKPVNLVDFGDAAYADQVKRDQYTEVGTPGYRAPEIDMEDPRLPRKYSVQTDIYALGVTLKHFFRRYPSTVFFQGDEDLARELDTLFEAMCVENPAKRISLKEVQSALAYLKNQLDADARAVNVCVLNIVDFMMIEQDDPVSLQALYQRLRTFHQIRLFDETGGSVSVATLLSIKQKLEKNEFVVANKVYLGSVAEMRAYVSKRNTRSSGTGRIYHMAYDAPEPELVLNVHPHLMERGDTIIEMGDFPPEAPGNEDEELLSSTSDDEYDVCECIGNFFSELSDDIARFAEKITRQNRQPSTCSRLFTCAEQGSGTSERIERETLVAFDDETSDEELFRMV